MINLLMVMVGGVLINPANIVIMTQDKGDCRIHLSGFWKHDIEGKNCRDVFNDIQAQIKEQQNDER